jgi:hypothetical protein
MTMFVGQGTMKKNYLLTSVIFFITLLVLSKSSIVGLGESLKKLKVSLENIVAKLTKKEHIKTTIDPKIDIEIRIPQKLERGIRF